MTNPDHQAGAPAPRSALFAYGFRPFFLLAGWFALLSLGLWLWLHRSGQSPLAPLPGQLWHGHEMLFGFIAAAIAGFLLTAVPSWTGRRGFGGLPLIALSAVWLAGRVAFLLGGAIPLAWLAWVELAFLPLLAVLLAPTLLRSLNRNSPMLLVLAGLWACDAMFLHALGKPDPALAGRALLTALDIVLILITLIGGRIVPAFTASALRQQGLTVRMARFAGLERVVMGSMIVLLIVDLLGLRNEATAAIAGVAGLAQAWRLAGWQGWRGRGQPIVWILHAAYAWLPLGLLLKSAWLFGGFGWAAFWQHALGAGAAATMILAVMSRAALGHTGRPLRVAPAMAWSYLLLILAVVLRVFGPSLLPLSYHATVLLAGGAWLLGFGIFVGVYSPILLRARVDGKPG